MDDFRAIYRILKTLSAAIDDEEFGPARLSAEALEVSGRRRNALLVMLAKNGYVDGIEAATYRSDPDPWPSARLVAPRTTLRGLEYLQEKPVMRRRAGAAPGIAGAAL